MPDIQEVELLLAFVNLNGYTAQVSRLPELDVARVMSGYYALVDELVVARGGRVVKFIGDAALVVFPAGLADAGVDTVLALADEIGRFMHNEGWECRPIAKVHYGTVAAGVFGGGAAARYDVLGKAVNLTARLESSGVALSAEAFRRLDPAMRQRFKKHTPPITYIRVDDAHQPRWAKR